MSTPLLQYLEKRKEDAMPAKGALPDKREWVDFCEFELKGKRLCICDSWGPYDGVMAEMAPGRYAVRALCYSYSGDVRVAALRIALPGAQGVRGEPLGEFVVDVGAVGITDIDLAQTLGDDAFGEWIESYSHAASHPPAGRHPCPEAETELLFTEAGWGDGWYTVHALVQNGQAVGAEVYFIEKDDEAYPFDLVRDEPIPPTPEEAEVIDEIIAVAKEIGLSTQPIDRAACIAAFSALYAAHGLPKPEFVFCTSLMDMRNKAHPMIPAGRNFLDDVAGKQLFLFPNVPLAERRESGIWRYVWEPLECFHYLKYREHHAEQKAGVSRPTTWQLTSMMIDGTWGNVHRIATRVAAEKLGLREPDEQFHRAAHALATCGGAGCYERYCFISERPARIAYPAVTAGAPAGRCRIEWRDGFVCDEALDD